MPYQVLRPVDEGGCSCTLQLHLRADHAAAKRQARAYGGKRGQQARPLQLYWGADADVDWDGLLHVLRQAGVS